MQRPPLALLNDYLRGLELLDILREKKDQIHRDSLHLSDLGYDPEAVIESIDEKIHRLEVWIEQTDTHLDLLLHSTTDCVEEALALFLSIRRSLKEWSTLDNHAKAALNPEVRDEWESFVRQFESLEEVWNGYVSAGDPPEYPKSQEPPES